MARNTIIGTNKGANQPVNVDGIPSNMLLTDYEREQLVKKTKFLQNLKRKIYDYCL